jgi:hypothetical protein
MGWRDLRTSPPSPLSREERGSQRRMRLVKSPVSLGRLACKWSLLRGLAGGPEFPAALGDELLRLADEVRDGHGADVLVGAQAH